jgi:hypothetical protein
MTSTNKALKARTIKFTTKGGNVLVAVEFTAGLFGEAPRHTGIYHVQHNGVELKCPRTGRSWSLSGRTKVGCRLAPLGVNCHTYKEALDIVARHNGIA